MYTSFLPVSTPISRNFIHGAVEVEQTPAGLLPHRLPGWARAEHDDAQLAMAESQPSGVRLVFETRATALELLAVATKRVYSGMPPRPDGVYELLVDGRLFHRATIHAGSLMKIDPSSGSTTFHPGTAQPMFFNGLPAGLKRIEIWLPHDEMSELVALYSDAALVPIAASVKRRWVHHGSSISQGSNTAHPTGTWPAVAATRAGVNLLNLGFGGSALLDPLVARTIRDLPADLISIKIGINLVNRDLLRLRTLGPAVHGFLDTIRDGHSNVPLVVVSPIFCPIHENVPGPTMFDTTALMEGRVQFQAAGGADEVRQGKLTLSVIREQLRAIVEERKQRDPHLHYVDGCALYGPGDQLRLPLPDNLHPDEATHRLIGERFAEVLRTSLTTCASI